MTDANWLEQLRPYRLPDAVGIWPPAPGWWLLTAVVILGVWLVLRWARPRWRHGWQGWRSRRAALRELAAIRQALAASGSPPTAAARARALQRLSTLLRRYVLRRFPQAGVAGLHGEAWLQFLAAQGEAEVLLGPPGRLLLTGPYRRTVDDPVDALLAAVERWLQRQPGAPA